MVGMINEDLERTAIRLSQRPRGILAADESIPTIGKRFSDVGIKNTDKNRRDYRQMLFTTPGLSQYINGVILNEETLYQNASDGGPLIKILEENEIIPGVKVDKGTIDMPNYSGEKITQGLDDLRERLQKHKERGAKFTKWRAVYAIGGNIPSEGNIQANAHGLAMYTALSQEQGLAAIPEPEVLIDGDHDIIRCFDATSKVLEAVFKYLDWYGVNLKGIVLKPNMVVPGKEYPKGDYTSDVVRYTLRALSNEVPIEVPAIAFLSGGLDDDAIRYLDAMNKIGGDPYNSLIPSSWKLTFSFARALQNVAMEEFSNFLKGYSDGIRKGQEKLLEEARKCSLATEGKYVV